MRPFLVVHGGAGPVRPPAGVAEAAIRRDLAAAIDAGLERLEDGAEAACVAAVAHLEGCAAFNAGTGSSLAADGGVWCDAAVMTGDGRAAGVAGVQGLAHPVRAAHALARSGGPVLWAGHAAALAERTGLELVDPATMVTERQRRRLAAHRRGASPDARGTVGAVCLDPAGALAAATSTGGYVGKPPGRVGDSPILGAGTWASERCAVSATGDGEAFMRTLYAHSLDARLATGRPLAAAAAEALEAVRAAGGLGGAICVTAGGEIAMPCTDEVMLRAWRGADGITRTALSAQDPGVISAGGHEDVD
jgi:beta-aspartyl-peptidase (threonine type)